VVSTATNGYYTHGYVTLENANVQGSEVTDYHPIAVNSWYYMKTTLPRILTQINDPAVDESGFEALNQLGSLLSMFTQLGQMFSGFRRYCFDLTLADRIDVDRSWIKLGSPDGIKYGGGCRVKKLYMKDDEKWTEDGEADVIGQVYEYTMEERGKTISSGVASYEPIMGGDENALKYAKFYPQNLPLKSANDLFFEYPVNESYFPSPQVGYRKITVKSLATDKLKKNPTDPAIEGILATGETVHEFYTAKDFPTIVEETDLEMHNPSYIVPLPLVGMLTDNRLRASQGYMIKLNDMHGKPKAVYSRGINKNGTLSPIETSRVEYKYKMKPRSYENRAVFELDNTVDVLVDDPNMKGLPNLTSGSSTLHEAIVQPMILGMDYEFFYDMRQGRTEAGSGGLDFNLDMVGFGPFEFPIPLPWPSFNYSHAKSNIVVTNKVIHKAGIIDEVIATDGQSVVRTKNLVYDPVTGSPLLTAVNNNFDKPVYKYDIPGRLMHSGMEAASRNSLLEFYTQGANNINTSENTVKISDATTIVNPYTNTSVALSVLLPLLEEGDEFIVGLENTSLSSPVYPLDKRRFYLTDISSDPNCATSYAGNTYLTFYVKEGVSGLTISGGGVDPDIRYHYKLIRSGKRNLLSTHIGSITSLSTDDLNNPVSINSSPLKNRISEDLSSVTVANYFPFFVDWLNDILDNTGALPLGFYDVDSPPFASTHPELGGVVDYIIIGPSVPVSSGCGTACPSVMTTNQGVQPSGYSVIIKLKDEYGGDCITSSCFARLYDDNGHRLGILDFSYVPPCSLNVQYMGNPPIGCHGATVFTCPEETIVPQIFKLKNVLQISSYIPSDVWSTITAAMYADGSKGIWRPSVDYYYKDDRYQQESGVVMIGTDGVFDGKNQDRYTYLFNWWASQQHPLPVEWIMNNNITEYNVNGVAVETKDILGIYNSTLFDKNLNLPIAIADNTQKKELFNLNFDNDGYQPANGNASVYSTIAFTGKNSLKVTNNYAHLWTFGSSFGLIPGKTYVLSAWAGGYNMTISPKQIDQDFPGMMNIQVKFYNSSNTQVGSTVALRPGGMIYEGLSNSYWRRIDGEFTVPANAAKIELVYTKRETGYTSVFGNLDNAAYFDDVRIFPADAVMKTFVYDASDFRLKAELNENNFPTYYGYDASGQLNVVKVLTENGIKTIKEVYSNMKKP